MIIEESVKQFLLQKIEDFVKDIEPNWTVEHVEDGMFYMHTHSTEALTHPVEFHIFLNDNFPDYEINVFSVRIIDGELVFVYHIY